MQSREIPPEVAQAILGANRAATDRFRVRRVEVDQHGQLWILSVATNQHDGDRGFDSWEFERRMESCAELATVETWHPVSFGAAHTVAEVLVQLADDLRKQVVAVQFLGKAVEDVLNPTEPTAENCFLCGWTLYRTRLYRRSLPVDYEVRQQFVLPDSAFDETGEAHLVIVGGWYNGRWMVSVVRPKRGDVGEVIGVIWTEEVTRPGAPDDVVETTRRWIVAQLSADTTEGYFKFLDRDVYAANVRDFFAGGQMILLRANPPNA